MNTTNEQVQQVKSYFESKDYGQLMKIVEQASGPSSQEVVEELEIQIENLKREAIKQFDQECYSDCLKSFQFLCELQPENRNFKDYLELSRQILAEKESSHENAGVVSAYQIFDESDLALKKSRGRRKNIPENDQVAQTSSSKVTQVSPSALVSSPSESRLVRLSEVEDSAVSLKANRSTLLLKRVLRVAALVAAFLLFFGMLGYWIHRVRAPHLPEQPVAESNPSQSSGNEQKVVQIEEQKKVVPKARTNSGNGTEPKAGNEIGPKAGTETGQIESTSSAPEKTLRSGNTSKEDSQITEVYPVVHEHRFGSCKGQLHISSRTIRYLPFEDSGDGFKRSTSEIIGVELDHKLKMEFPDRTYRFTGNSSESKQANLAELNRIYRQLIKFKQ